MAVAPTARRRRSGGVVHDYAPPSLRSSWTPALRVKLYCSRRPRAPLLRRNPR